jgi:hypothetical protein
VNADHRLDPVPPRFAKRFRRWVALLALAWVVTFDQVRAMGNGAGTDAHVVCGVEFGKRCDSATGPEDF